MTRVLLTFTLLLAACSAPAAPPASPPDDTFDGDGPPERVFGTIAFYEEPVTVTVPQTATVGEPFSVTVVTYGGGCTEKGETDVRLEPLRAEIRPYDYNVAPGQACDTALRTFEHTATLSFTEAGEADIVFYGQKTDASGTSNTMLTRTLEVQ